MIKNIEDLLVWQKARLFNKEIYKLIKQLPLSERNNLIDQLKRSSVSVSANIAEGFGRYNSQESIQFYRTARGSLAEVRSHVYICLDLEYISNSEFQSLLSLADEIGKMLNSLITSTRSFRSSKLTSKL